MEGKGQRCSYITCQYAFSSFEICCLVFSFHCTVIFSKVCKMLPGAQHGFKMSSWKMGNIWRDNRCVHGGVQVMDMAPLTAAFTLEAVIQTVFTDSFDAKRRNSTNKTLCVIILIIGYKYCKMKCVSFLFVCFGFLFSKRWVQIGGSIIHGC